MANKGREGNAETKKEQPRNISAALREGLGSASRDTCNNVFELFTKLKVYQRMFPRKGLEAISASC